MQLTPIRISALRNVPIPRWIWGILVASVAALSAAPITRNMFVQDDQPAILEDDRAHEVAEWGRYWNEPYWPEKHGGYLFRPVGSLVLAGQWQLADGAPVSYRIISMTLSAAASIAVLGLLLSVLPVLPAVLAGLMFAVHPVHVEAVAVAVNQGELLVGIIAALALWKYITARRRGPLGWKHRWGLFLAVLIGGLIKENAAVLPLLLLAAEATILRGNAVDAGWRSRLREGWRPQLLMALGLAVLAVLRYRVHAGQMRATFTAEGIAGLTIVERAYTIFAGVVPEWLRLLLWPATLQADYSPGEILPLHHPSFAVLLGATLAALVVILGLRTATRAPAVSFGIWWVVIGLGPVSNILVPTGIVLAERTLYLPSIGAMIAVGGLLAVGLQHSEGSWRHRLIVALSVGVIVMGFTRSRSRFSVWQSPLTLWRQTVIDAPSSYRARFALGYLMLQMGWSDRAEVFMRDAIELYDGASGHVFTFADRLRHTNRCEEAIPYYERGLEIDEFAPGRSGYIACLAFVGRYEDGRNAALLGLGSGYYAPVFREWFRLLDSVRKSPPPPGTVRFPQDKMHLFAEVIAEPGAMKRWRRLKEDGADGASTVEAVP